MQGRPTRNLSDRDLRGLSTSELLDLIQEDIKDLDKAWRQRRHLLTPPPDPFAKPAKPGRGKRDIAVPAATQAEEWEEPVILHRVTCCDNPLGDFVPIARVRCPFCETWHRASEFPVVP